MMVQDPMLSSGLEIHHDPVLKVTLCHIQRNMLDGKLSNTFIDFFPSNKFQFKNWKTYDFSLNINV